MIHLVSLGVLSLGTKGIMTNIMGRAGEIRKPVTKELRSKVGLKVGK